MNRRESPHQIVSVCQERGRTVTVAMAPEPVKVRGRLEGYIRQQQWMGKIGWSNGLTPASLETKRSCQQRLKLVPRYVEQSFLRLDQSGPTPKSLLMHKFAGLSCWNGDDVNETILDVLFDIGQLEPRLIFVV